MSKDTNELHWYVLSRLSQRWQPRPVQLGSEGRQRPGWRTWWWSCWWCTHSLSHHSGPRHSAVGTAISRSGGSGRGWSKAASSRRWSGCTSDWRGPDSRCWSGCSSGFWRLRLCQGTGDLSWTELLACWDGCWWFEKYFTQLFCCSNVVYIRCDSSPKMSWAMLRRFISSTFSWLRSKTPFLPLSSLKGGAGWKKWLREGAA